jgi:hypothetical protein
MRNALRNLASKYYSIPELFMAVNECSLGEGRLQYLHLTLRVIKLRRMRWEGHVARMGEKRNAYRILVGKPEGKRPLGRPRRRWVDNIKRNLRNIGWDGIDWIDLAQDRDQWRALVNTVMNLRVT